MGAGLLCASNPPEGYERGEPLDHADDKLHYRGPAHAKCNLRAAAKRGNALMRAKQALNPSPSSVRVLSRDW
jgi:hypothetical protein